MHKITGCLKVAKTAYLTLELLVLVVGDYDMVIAINLSLMTMSI